MKFGRFSGKTLDEIGGEAPGLLDSRALDQWSFRWPGGENYEDVQCRVTDFLQAHPLTHAIASGDQLIVAHETSNVVMIGTLLGSERYEIVQYGQPNTVIYRIRDQEVEHLDIENHSEGWIAGMVIKNKYHSGSVRW